MNKPAVIALVITLLDAMGIGLIMPVLPSLLREYLNPWVISGYGLMVVSTLLTVGGYAGLEYKNGAVIESLGFMLVMLLSRLFFREKITKKKLIGNALILLGIAVFYS